MQWEGQIASAACPRLRESDGGLGGFIRRSGYLRKWLILGISIGIIAGLGAVVFYLALDYAGRFLLGYLAGYDIPTPIGDGGDPGSPGFDRPWAIPLVMFGGALVSAWLVAKFAPEAEGHGTDSAIEAVHTDPRAIRARAIAGQDGHQRGDDRIGRLGRPRRTRPRRSRPASARC